MRLSIGEILSWLSILAAAAASLYYAPNLPSRIATHFDIEGRPNGWMDKNSALIFGPAMAVGLYILLSVLIYLASSERGELRLDENSAEMMQTIKGLVVFLVAAVHIGILWHAVGVLKEPLSSMIVPISLMFAYIGWAITKAKRNWLMGVRLPWTLVDERAWRVGNLIMGWGLVVCAVLNLTGLFLPKLWFWILTVTLAAAVSLSVVASYIVYRSGPNATAR